MDLEQIGYFIYMEEQEEVEQDTKDKEEQEV